MELLASKLPKTLVEPFDQKLVKKNYQGFDYVSPSEYRKLLNDTFGSMWSFEILNYQILNDSVEIDKQKFEENISQPYKSLLVVVHGRLTIYIQDGDRVFEIKKDGIGASMVSKTVSFALKSAKSTALKNACLELGIGLDMYENDIDDMNDTDLSNDITNPNQQVYSGKQPTDKQINYATMLIKKSNMKEFEGLDEEEIKEKLKNMSSLNVSKIINKLK